jgi:hypothetical protein
VRYTKWKARLNCHGGQPEHGINFWETYLPVVNWFLIRLFLVTSILQNWDTRHQIDFVLAFPQADVECDIYMEVPVGFMLPGDKKKYCLKLNKNIYGTKQAGRVWNKHVNKGLLELGYKPSIIDPCVYYRGKTVFMIYVDDGIFAGPDRGEIERPIKEMQDKFNVTDEGDLKEYLGVLVDVGKLLFILFYESIFRDYSVFMTDRLTRLVYDFISSTTKKVSKTKKYPEPIFRILILIPSRSKHSRFDPDFYKDPLCLKENCVFHDQIFDD